MAARVPGQDGDTHHINVYFCSQSTSDQVCDTDLVTSSSCCRYLFLKMTKLPAFTVLFASFIIFLSLLDITFGASSETCEYDLDLKRSTVKITCQGSPSMVAVYAEKALLQADENFKASPGENTNDKPDFVKVGPKGENQKLETSGPEMRETERPTSTKPGTQNPGEPLGFQKDIQGMPSKYTGSFGDVVRKATAKLDRAKTNLSTYNDSIRNITKQLTEGDLLLTSDMEKLRRTSNSATDLKEGIIAAMKNQYSFMKAALLARNQELTNLVTSLSLLVDVMAEGLHSALTAHKTAMDEMSHVNSTLMTVRRMVSKELKNREKKPTKQRECPKRISAIGAGTSKTVHWPMGSYMIESVNPNEYRSVFIMAGTGPTDQLREYEAIVDVNYNLVARYFPLPFFCSGTGHVVYRRHFYCHKADSNLIVKYHLKRMDIVYEMALPGAQYGNTYPYSSGENTDIDLAVDELGLWAVYATEASVGKMVISKINHRKMEIERTWLTSYPKKRVGNSFMICGILYATDSHKDMPTFIRYIYSTETTKEQILEKGELPFANSALIGVSDMSQKATEEKSANSVMLSYDFRTSSLYSWNNGRIETFPVYFETMK